MKRLFSFIVIVGICWAGPAWSDSKPASMARPLEGSIRLSDVELVNQHGRTERFSDTIRNAQVSVINFSYTGCRTVCPLSNLVMQELEGAINLAHASVSPKLITLTIDPFQDSPQVMKEMAEQLGAGQHWNWYSGDPASVFAVLDGLNYKFGDLQNHPQRYLIIDSLRSRYLLLPDEVTAEQLLATAAALSEP